MIGIDSSEDCFKDEEDDCLKGSIYKLGVNIDGNKDFDGKNILSFGCSSKCTFFLMKSPETRESLEESKEPIDSTSE